MILGDAELPALPTTASLPEAAPLAASRLDVNSRTLGAALAVLGAISLFGPRRTLAVGAMTTGLTIWRIGAGRARDIAREHLLALFPR